jgi:hypothetical protein
MTQAETIGFDDDPPGRLPAAWRQGVTGKGAALWAVRADGSAPSKPNVLEQSATGAFPWCVLAQSSIEDGFVAVRFKALSGQHDQAGGIVWRWKDGDNYYVARANALENNVSLYHTTGEVLDVISEPGLERMARFLASFVASVDRAPRLRINP